MLINIMPHALRNPQALWATKEKGIKMMAPYNFQ